MNPTLKKFLYSRNLWGYIASVAIMIVLSLAFFHPDAVEGNSLSQADMRQGVANGQEIKEYFENTGEKSRWTNSLFSGMPTFQISPTYPSDSMFKWIDVAMRAGLPAPSGYLFSMMLGFLIMCACLRMKWYYALIGSVAWGFSSYFVIIIGAGHLWKFFTLTYVPPVIGGIVMAYRGRWFAGAAIAALFAMMQIAANHVQMSYYFLFLIVALAVAYLVKAIIRREIGTWCNATGALALAAVLALVANGPSLYHTYKYSKETIRGQHSLLSSPDSQNSGLDKDYITTYSYGRAETFSLLIPNIKGGATVKIENGGMKPLTLSQLPEAAEMAKNGRIQPFEAQYLDYVYQYFGEPEGTNGPVYVGAIVVALFLLGCVIVRGPLKWTLLTLTVISILLALGRNCMWLTDFFIDYVPMYKNFRTPESILVIAEFTMPLLAVLALARFMTADKPFTTYKGALLFAFGVPVFFCLLGILFPGIYGEAVTASDYSTSQMLGYQLQAQGYPQEAISRFSIDNPSIFGAVTQLRESLVESDSWRSLLFLLIALAAMFLTAKGFFPRWVAIAAVGVLIAGDLYSADKRYLNHSSFTTARSEQNLFPLTANDRVILADTCMNYRVMDIPGFWEPTASYRHKSIGGYHAAKLTRYQDLIERHLSKFTSGKADEADMSILDMLNARYIITPQGEVMYNDGALGNAWFIDNIDWVTTPQAEMEALSYIDPAVTAAISTEFEDIVKDPEGQRAPGDTIFETSYAPDRLTYHSSTSSEALAVFSEIYFPWGWTATVDGEEVPIIRADYLLRAINLPPGNHTVVMEFKPASVGRSVTWARISIILIYVLCAVALSTPFLTKQSDNYKTAS